MSRHFCCCIPVRVAVFVTSLLAFLLSGFVAGIAFYALIKSKNHDEALAQISSRQKVGLGVLGGVYTIIALASLFGFIGSVIRKRSFVALYSVMSWIIFLLQCASGGFLIFSLFHNVDAETCQVTIDGEKKPCKDLSGALKGVIIGIFALTLIIEAYIVVVIRRYVTQLDEEQSYHRTSGYVDSAFKMGPTNASHAYYPHQPLNEGLLHPQGTYAYSDPHHSFGNP